MGSVQADSRRLAEVAVARLVARKLASKQVLDPRLAACRQSFRAFLPYWHFRNRETGDVQTFADLWDGQDEFARAAEDHKWVYYLKAGKLGFSELECAFDAWSALFVRPNAFVAIFSKEQKAARSLLGYVSFGLSKLPSWMGVTIERDNTDEIELSVAGTFDDIRTIRCFPVTEHTAIDLSLSHAHVDELSQMEHGEALWSSVNTVIAPGGTCHVLTRGRGDMVYSAQLWKEAIAAPEQLKGQHGYLYPLFVPWDRRPLIPERDKARLAESGSYTPLGLSYFLPDTPEEALMGDMESAYIPVEQWDRCHDPAMPPLQMGSREPCVIGIDAASKDDCFAVVVATRHPVRQDIPAIRWVRVWRPQESPTGQVDLEEPDRFVRWLVQGGCVAGHPPSKPLVNAHDMTGAAIEDCQYCVRQEFTVPGLNVLEIAYDPYQMEAMAQDMIRDGIWGLSSFDQGKERWVADAQMFRWAMRIELAHNGSPALREHIHNSRAKLQKDEESKMRIIKAAPAAKVDAAVAASMATKRIMDMLL